MTYPLIGSHRMAYDIDGTAVGYKDAGESNIQNVFNNGIASWLTNLSTINLNKEDRTQEWAIAWKGPVLGFWFFFPEIREVEFMGLLFPFGCSTANFNFQVQGSSDSTNGIDGTWETASITKPIPAGDSDFWRAKIFPISFSGPVKVLRVGMSNATSGIITTSINAIHLYGRKAAGQTIDDILFVNGVGTELAGLKDWGDQPEGTTEVEQVFYIKNVSPTKIANGVNVQLNHADFGISFSIDGPWTSTLDISSIAPGSLSAPVYIKNSLGPPLLILGPRSGRVIATVNSWV